MTAHKTVRRPDNDDMTQVSARLFVYRGVDPYIKRMISLLIALDIGKDNCEES